MTAEEPKSNPYVGLRPFEREDSRFFFGRRGQTIELLEQLHQSHFLAVVGGSGCGKSSLIRAGLIPALLGGFLVEERDRWQIAMMKPGDAPRHNLAVALAGLGEKQPEDSKIEDLSEEIFQNHTQAVVDHILPLLGDDNNLLLLVDQFEEIFTFRGKEDEEEFAERSREQRREIARRRAESDDFVDLIIELGGRMDLPVYTILTMRTDFLGDCDIFYGLPEAMNRSRYLVPRLNRQELRDVTNQPDPFNITWPTTTEDDTVMPGESS